MSHNTQTTRPATASEILRHAERTLGERGKQYDPAAKQERSMTAIVAAFNAIYPVHLTVHMGWQFMALVKMVRGATKPHADSALDQVAYAALAAEEVATSLHRPAALCEDEGCPHYGMHHVCLTSEVSYTSLQVSNQALAEELGKCQHWAGVQSQELKHLEAKAIAAHEAYMQALEHNRSLEVQLDATHSALSDFVCRFDLTKEYMTKEQVLAGQAKHAEQVATLRDRLEEAEKKAEYREKRNAELCAQLESARNSLRLSEQAADEKIQLLSNELTAKTQELVQMHTQREAPIAHNTDEAADIRKLSEEQAIAPRPLHDTHLLPRGGLVNPTRSGSLCDSSVASQLS